MITIRVGLGFGVRLGTWVQIRVRDGFRSGIGMKVRILVRTKI